MAFISIEFIYSADSLLLPSRNTIPNRAERRDLQIIVNIRDTDKGIAKEIMPRLFTKFASKAKREQDLVYIYQKQ
jgi:K+-sensing histidine kinase KdpD